MIFNLVFIIGLILYTIYGYIKGSASMIVNLVAGIFSLIIAAISNNFVAMLLSKYITLMDMDDTMSVLLGSEYVYFKVSAFLLVFIISAVILTKVLSRFEDVEAINFESKIAKINFAFFAGLFHLTILLSVALATPYALKYSNSLSSTLSNIPGVGTVMNNVSYDYNDFQDILDKNPNLKSDEINVIVMEEMIKDGYGSKKSFKSVLSSSNWYTSEVEKWLEK